MIRHCQPMSLLFLCARHGRVNVAKARSLEDLADPATAKGKKIKRAAPQKAWIAQRAKEYWAAPLPGKGRDQGRAWNPAKFDPKCQHVSFVQLAEQNFSNNKKEKK